MQLRKEINRNNYELEVIKTLVRFVSRPRDSTNNLPTLDSPRLSTHSKDVCCPPTGLPRFRPSPESRTVDRCRPLDQSSCNQKKKKCKLFCFSFSIVIVAVVAAAGILSGPVESAYFGGGKLLVVDCATKSPPTLKVALRSAYQKVEKSSEQVCLSYVVKKLLIVKSKFYVLSSYFKGKFLKQF